MRPNVGAGKILTVSQYKSYVITPKSVLVNKEYEIRLCHDHKSDLILCLISCVKNWSYITQVDYKSIVIKYVLPRWLGNVDIAHNGCILINSIFNSSVDQNNLLQLKYINNSILFLKLIYLLMLKFYISSWKNYIFKYIYRYLVIFWSQKQIILLTNQFWLKF